MSKLSLEIARLPVTVVAGAYKKYCARPKAGITKTEATAWLEEYVATGFISLPDIINGFFNSINVFIFIFHKL